jgi:Tol biopolymer transport system component
MPRFHPLPFLLVLALLLISALLPSLGTPLQASPYATGREEKSEFARHVSITSTGADTRRAEAAMTGITSLVSIASDGQQGNADSGLVRIKVVPGTYIAIPPAISGDGRYIAFVSDASNLVPNASLGRTSIYVRDRLADQTVRVTEAQDGTEANDDSSNPAMSANGRFIAFSSTASNLLPDTWNGWYQVYLHDQQTGQLTLISKDSNGNPLTGGAFVLALSGDGRYAALRVNSYYSPSLVLYDIVTASTVITISQDPQAASLSFDGRYLAFMTSSDLLPGGQDSYDVYRFDRVAGTTQRVSVSSSGVAGDSTSGDPAISADGRYVAFASSASNLAPCLGSCYQDIFVHDCDTGNTYRILVGIDGLSANESSFSPSISADGRYIAFMSHASNLVPGNRMAFYDLFVVDRTTGAISRISEAYDDTPSDGDSHMPRMSGDGRFVAYDSFASNLIAGDTNGYPDVFVYDRLGGSFSVSGKVLNSSSIPIPGVMISAGVGHSTITDSSGYYTITGLITGTYTIMPAKVGFTFSPITRTVSVPPDASGEDFLGVSAAWIPFHNISSSCTNWTPLTSINFTTSLTNGIFSIDGTKMQGIYWAEAAGFETPQQITTSKPIVLEMTGILTGTGSGWSMNLALADDQNSVYLGAAYDGPSGRRVVLIQPHVGRYIYPIDIGGCGTETTIANSVELERSHTYRMTYSERVEGAGIIASAAASVDDGTPVTVDLPWRLNSPNALLVASARAIGDSVHASMTEVVAGTSYSISGQVTNSSNAPIPNVMVSAGSNFSATTNSSGYYTITGLIAGTYTITPTKAGYAFSPPTRTLTVPPDATGQGFTGINNQPIADLAVEQPINVTNSLYPFLPNHLTLDITVTNRLGSVNIPSVVVTFYDGDPDSGGQQINWVPAGNLDPGVSREVAVDWWLTGNIENHRVYARATSSAAYTDPDLTNNTTSRPISVYYVDFRHSRDAYSMDNKSGDLNYTSTNLKDDVENLLREADLNEWLFGPLYTLLGRIAEFSGYCYGMSSTSILYYENSDLKPVPKDTYDMTVNEALGNIKRYQRWQMVDIIFQRLFTSFNADAAYSTTRNSIMAGVPTIHGLAESGKDGGHSVVAYKIVVLDNEKRVYYYDPNNSLNALENVQHQETYGTFKGGTFSYPAMFLRNPNYTMNEVYPMNPTSSPDNLAREIASLILRFFQDLFQSGKASVVTEGSFGASGVASPALAASYGIVIRDPQGRRIGIVAGTVIDEIPGATIETFDSFQFYSLPRDLVYTVEASSETSGTFSLYVNFPIDQSTVRSLGYDDVALVSGVTATASIGLSNTDVIMQVGNQEVNPNINITASVNNLGSKSIYLPLVLR